MSSLFCLRFWMWSPTVRLDACSAPELVVAVPVFVAGTTALYRRGGKTFEFDLEYTPESGK